MLCSLFDITICFTNDLSVNCYANYDSWQCMIYMIQKPMMRRWMKEYRQFLILGAMSGEVLRSAFFWLYFGSSLFITRLVSGFYTQQRRWL